MVKDVKHFHAELPVDTFLVDGEILEQRQIHVFKARSVDLVAAQIAVAATRRNGKAVFV